MAVLAIRPVKAAPAPGPLTIRIPEDDSHHLGIIDSPCRPAPRPPQHRHREHDETARILSGNPVFSPGAETSRPPRGLLSAKAR